MRGEFIVLIGPSGCGKSTLIKIVAGLEDASEGTVERPENVAMVFQSGALFPWLTVAENLDLPLSYKDIKKSERASMVGDTLDRFNIVGKKDLFPSQLSGGQQQLVAVARAIIAKPARQARLA